MKRLRGLLFLMLMLVIPAPLSAALSLAGAIETPVDQGIPAVSSPQAVALADVTGDGVLDALVVGGSGYGKFACFPGKGDGTFEHAAFGGTVDVDPLDLAVGDFNNDGALDVAVANAGCG